MPLRRAASVASLGSGGSADRRGPAQFVEHRRQQCLDDQRARARCDSNDLVSIDRAESTDTQSAQWARCNGKVQHRKLPPVFGGSEYGTSMTSIPRARISSLIRPDVG